MTLLGNWLITTLYGISCRIASSNYTINVTIILILGQGYLFTLLHYLSISLWCNGVYILAFKVWKLSADNPYSLVLEGKGESTAKILTFPSDSGLKVLFLRQNAQGKVPVCHTK